MTDPTPTNQSDPGAPTGPEAAPGSDAAAAPPRQGFTLRGRRWVYGATLAAAGVLAGSGVTYAVVSATPPAQSQAFSQDGSGQRGAPAGGPPVAPQGALPEGQTPGAQGSASGGETA